MCKHSMRTARRLMDWCHQLYSCIYACTSLTSIFSSVCISDSDSNFFSALHRSQCFDIWQKVNEKSARMPLENRISDAWRESYACTNTKIWILVLYVKHFGRCSSHADTFATRFGVVPHKSHIKLNIMKSDIRKSHLECVKMRTPTMIHRFVHTISWKFLQKHTFWPSREKRAHRTLCDAHCKIDN